MSALARIMAMGMLPMSSEAYLRASKAAQGYR